ncbi:hypothetical protein DXG01_016475 [Tephrocybe rancida]|nr:hypothetical protein DXG01_016475 [Tephrocybe rancida]
MATELPQYVYGTILPHDTLNVLDLLKFSTPKTAPDTLPALNAPNIFSQASSLINTATSAQALLGLTMPRLLDLIHLEQHAEEAARSGFISFNYAVDGSRMRMSFWVIGFWKAAHEVIIAKEQWTSAKAWLEDRADGRGILEGLTRLPWKHTLPREIGGDTLGLTMLASNKWLGTTQMAQIATVINSNLEEKLGSTEHSLGQDFTDKLLLAYRYSRDTHLTDKSCQFMQKIADKTRTGKWTRLSLPAEDTISTPDAKRTKPHTIKIVPRVKMEAKPATGDVANTPGLHPVFQQVASKSNLAIEPATGVPEDDGEVVIVENDNNDSWQDEEEVLSDDGEDTAEYVEPKDLIDVVRPTKKKSGNGKAKGGRPRSALIDRLLVECYKVSNPSKHIHRCVAAECGATWVSRSLQRALCHQRTCSYIPKDLRNEVRKILAARSASRRIQEVAQKEAAKKAGVTTETADSENTDIAHNGKKSGGLPTLLTSRPEFVDLLYKLDPKYPAPSRTRLEDDLIPAEAAEVQEQMYEVLRQGENLTLSVDGGTSRGKEAFWTMHISMEGRKVYFIEAKEATRESHTAEWIKNWVLEVADQIGRERFCCMVCDSTGNTRLSRKISVEAILTMFNLPDICHHFSNTIKDIVRIDHFKTDLDEHFKEFAGGRLSQAASKFVATLGQLIDIGKPALKALTFLESNEATPGDVFVFWHATLQAMDRILNDPDQEIPFEARLEIIGILNHRHDQIFGQGNLSDSADLYLSGAYLHPLYVDSDFFKHEPAVLDPNAKRYGRRQYPYNQPYDEEQGVSGWWKAIEGQESATILPVLARKIHAVRVNSMPEERTVSTFTWLTPALRANLSIGSITSMTQIRQFYQTESKQRAHSNSRPSSAFEAKTTSIHHHTEMPIDDTSDKWLDEPLEPVESAVELDVMLPNYPVNMKSKSLETVFGGKKGVKAKKSVSVRPEQLELPVAGGSDSGCKSTIFYA